MKRSQSRAASPTPTAFSGISNYRTESYRPIRDKNVPAVPSIDYRQISKIHYDELSKYLAAYLAKAPPNARSSAREKLTRLTIQQFHELSTDVYDELIRRQNEKEVPFLPVREEFHPKRNQARQKLATLPTLRFEDLSSDVYYELLRRYPEFKEDPSGRASNGSNYDDYPAPGFNPAASPPRTSTSRTSGRPSLSDDAQRPSTDSRRRPSEDMYSARVSEDTYTPSSSLSSRRKPSQDSRRQMSTDTTSRRQASQDTTGRRSEDREREREYPMRRPSAPSVSGTSDSGTVNTMQSGTATSGMVIPNKSTIEEEYIEVPYGRESGSTTQGDGKSRNASQDVTYMGGINQEELDSASDYPMSPRSPAVGLSALSARLKTVDDEEEDTGRRSGDDYLDRSSNYGRSSVNSERSVGGMASRFNGRQSVQEDSERMRRDYEYKIATMQSQISTMQRDLDDASRQAKHLQESEARVRQMEEELQGVRRRAEEQTSTMRAMQKELDDLRETRQREKEREARRAQQDEDELQILRDRCEVLEQEREDRNSGGADPEVIEQLNADMQSLLTELDQLSRRNEELMTAKDSDLIVIRDLDGQLKEYKRKYEQAKTELRSVKATSQLYLQAPKLDRIDEQVPVTADGGVLDIHLTAFMSAIDSLLTAARSNAPTRVLTPMKAVVNAVTSITDDVRNYERRPQPERAEVDQDMLRSLRDRAEATLGNLVAASKTHATSSGMSPVSLLDAAASHVSATITEITKMVMVRKATKAEQDQFTSPPYTPSATATNGFSPSLRSVVEKEAHHRKNSSAFSGSGRFVESPASTTRPLMFDGYRQRTPSDNSSSDNTNSPPPIFDRPSGVMSDDSATGGETAEDNWNELKPYIETQNATVIDCIQIVLSGVRSPTPSPNLMDNVTQIITIVSSIVAVCTDNLPPAHIKQGTEILQELSEHATRLSDVQALPEVTKESRQIMARSSFAVANAMKALSKL